MKNIQWLYIALLAVCLQAHAQQNNMQRAQQILQWMKNTQSDSIYACFDAKMQQAVPMSQLNNMWSQMEQQLGSLVEEKGWKQDAIGGTIVYYSDLKFERAPIRFMVAFNQERKVNGLRLLPVPAEEKPQVIPFDSIHLEESPIEVVTGTYKLPGVITQPKGKSNLPIVILLQGSGPHNKDGQIGPNKIYQDPLSMHFSNHAIFCPKMRMVCKPSLSLRTSSGVKPCTEFQYCDATIGIFAIVKY